MSIQICNFPFHPRFALQPRGPRTAARSRRVFASGSDQQQQLNLSVLRFTFGIPGLDESYLPRWIGYGFGSLILLNHFSASSPINQSQLRSEALGLSLAAFSIALPYFGKFLKGSEVEKRSLPEVGEQVFVISPSIGDFLKEDLAWGTYVLLRNTSTVAVMISLQGELCVRGYWNFPGQMSKAQLHDWFKRKVDEIGLADVKETLYFPQYAGSALSWDILPDGTRSVFVQPLVQNVESEKMDGFLLVASTAGYAYSDKDRAWIGAMADKFRG
ncbi:unnamed protein product [Eruca vesicaria subsp. sativa]|uniref:Protein COFACTOR ASSEMBLY OF COMPLEX C SUBUNIT B CCB2, chloroplastic n=1 Tax=Eruca vesicaria subsp. sativa TaxID=29727 RepID=A0ABC8LJB7_ERUVS|nr:unnamed protein product [Eruca vesicaria subsp. sativa]